MARASLDVRVSYRWDVLDNGEAMVYSVVLTTPFYCLFIGSIALFVSSKRSTIGGRSSRRLPSSRMAVQPQDIEVM